MPNRKPTRRADRSVRHDQARTARQLLAQAELLEPRTLLSGDLRAGYFGGPGPLSIPGERPSGDVEIVRWHGSPVYAKTDSWVFSFSDRLGEARAVEMAQEVAARIGVNATAFKTIGGGKWVSLTTPDTVREADVARVALDLPGFLGATPNRVYLPTARPNDPQFNNQYWLENTGQFIGAPGVPGADIRITEAWNTTTGSSSVVIGVIDSGIQVDHPDLAANIYVNPGEIAGNNIDDDGNGFVDDVNGWDFGAADNDPDDDVIGHGTAVAGTLGAVGNNGLGISGVNWNVSILPLKIADRFGQLLLEAIIGAHDYCTMMIGRGVNIVATNNSYRGIADEFYSDAPVGFDPEKDAIANFIATGATFVASAGNDTLDNDSTFRAFPASYNLPGLISVAATDNTDTLTGFSNYGAETVDLAAPGQFTLTTAVNSSYSYASGTSFSGPIVAGVVGLLKAYKPNASGTEIRQILIDSVDVLPSLQGKMVSGGRVNVTKAMRRVGVEGPVVRSIDPGPVTGQVDINTGTVLRLITVRFNKELNPGALSTAGVTLIGNGVDNGFGNADDVTIPIQSITLSASDHRVALIALELAGQPSQRLPFDRYRLTLNDQNFRDLSGNVLNGAGSVGFDEEYLFDVVPISAENEPNDTLLTSTPAVFSASGVATFSGATLGNGLAAGLDVDIYRIDLARGGQITAEINAKRRNGGSTLDSVIRLFNAAGTQIAINDQFFGQDSYVDFFVTTGGAYYVAVSGFGNDRYDPTRAGSGSTQSNGVYDLTITAQLVGDDRREIDRVLDIPKRIPANGTQGTITDTIEVTDSRQILDVNVSVDLNHDFDSDLVITITSPAGTSVTLSNRRGGAGRNFTGTTFDDEGATPIASGAAPFTGIFRPDSALSLFDGQAALGTWILTITDVSTLNSGQLNSWGLDFTLSNNIFGPFESNDTIVTAKGVTEIDFTSGGSATRDAFLGDGGFGLFDRDVFRISVNAGTTLTVGVTPILPPGSTLDPDTEPSLNSALRIFDSQGREISNSAPSASIQSRIEALVLRDGGIYYVAVSEGANTAYDPYIVTSGSAAVTTGDYRLTIQAAPGVGDRPIMLDGSIVDAGFGPSGLFVSGPSNDPTTAGLRWNGIEFLFKPAPQGSARPRALFGATASGSNFLNQSGTDAGAPDVIGAQLPLSITAASDTFNRRVTSAGLFGSLKVERALSFGVNDSFVAIDIFLTNLSANALPGVTWMEAINPDQGLNTSANTVFTSNDVDDTRPFARASVINTAFPQGLTIALAAPASDARASAKVVSGLTRLRDPQQLLAMPDLDPNGAVADDLLALGFDVGNLSPANQSGSQAHLRYFVLLGSSVASVSALYNTINAGTGAGHLTGDTATPATEALSNGQIVHQFPYRVYYPEGYANSQTYTFVPILNHSSQPNRVTVIARYETGVRDQVVSDFVIPADSRSGITITSPELYASNTLMVRKDTPYALEIRSQYPVTATFSHYDQFILAGGRAAIGESFTTQVAADWTFGQITKSPSGGDVSDFLLFINTTDEVIKVESVFYPVSTGVPVRITQLVEPYRRAGLNINDVSELAAGEYGVKVVADAGIVASLSHYDRANRGASGLAGAPDAGATSGVIPEGFLGIGSQQEIIGVLNPNAAVAHVDFSFVLSDGTTYRTVLNVSPNKQAELDVSSLPQFPIGQPYSILYSSDVAVSLSLRSLAFGEGLSTVFSNNAFTLWGFGEGFRPAGQTSNVVETLDLYNPNDAPTLVEVTIRFDNNLGQETFRLTVPAKRSVTQDIHQFVTGNRRNVLAFYGLTVKSADPIVASMTHYDPFFPGAFTTLGTPLGIIEPVS